MPKNLKITTLSVALLALLLVAPANALDINESIKIAAGSEASGASTVNGSVTVGKGATVTGNVETVNGSIRIEENAVIEDAETVNGSIKIGSGVKAENIDGVNGAIRIGKNVTITGDVSVVNGMIAVDAGSKIAEDVSNVNGEIRLTGAEVGGNLSTVNGDVALNDGANLRGNLTIEKPAGFNWNKDDDSRMPRVTIGPGSRVGGKIIAEREVELYISDTAEVGGVSGVMTMDQAVRFSGKSP